MLDHLPLVGYLVSDLCMRVTNADREEMAAVGALALVAAAGSYDPQRGVPFGAFVRIRINGAFADEMRSVDWATRGTRRRIRETRQVRDSLAQALCREPSTDELAAALGVSRSEVEATLQDASRRVSPLDELTAQMIADQSEGPEDALFARERAETLRHAVEALPERMRRIVRDLYFGDKTVKDLAAELGCTHSAVSQQRSEALRLLRDAVEPRVTGLPTVPGTRHSRVAADRYQRYMADFEQAAARPVAAGLEGGLRDGQPRPAARTYA
ncbi:RNA polymerase sigma factor FliA [Zafaria cholistanensis]|uniref:RNA polymerase sigma factor FliA n=1 Tax=Zafaria cholistanensis TaxID=1682741 RepID=A0A5A7NL01_9MICC|nr:RNA polymerase sigma factor FliA [Zafaria cholistanensis]